MYRPLESFDLMDPFSSLSVALGLRGGNGVNGPSNAVDARKNGDEGHGDWLDGEGNGVIGRKGMNGHGDGLDGHGNGLNDHGDGPNGHGNGLNGRSENDESDQEDEFKQVIDWLNEYYDAQRNSELKDPTNRISRTPSAYLADDKSRGSDVDHDDPWAVRVTGGFGGFDL